MGQHGVRVCPANLIGYGVEEFHHHVQRGRITDKLLDRVASEVRRDHRLYIACCRLLQYICYIYIPAYDYTLYISRIQCLSRRYSALI